MNSMLRYLVTFWYNPQGQPQVCKVLQSSRVTLFFKIRISLWKVQIGTTCLEGNLIIAIKIFDLAILLLEIYPINI